MARPSGLGKGLGALIPAGPEAPSEGELKELPIDSVYPNRYQPRSSFDDGSLEELAASIKVLGVLQPVLVRRATEETGELDSFELIAGERRWRAAQLAGLDTIPALVREVEHQQSLEHALVENLHREDLNPIEEAVAYRQLIDDFGLSHDEVATRVGRSRSAVTNTIRLLQLPPEVLSLMVGRQLGAGHGRALLALEAAPDQILLAKMASEEGWSVRRVEDEVRQFHAPQAPAAPDKKAEKRASPADRPAALYELEDLLASHLDTRVQIQLGGKSNRILVEFGGIEDLERIYRAMVSGRETD